MFTGENDQVRRLHALSSEQAGVVSVGQVLSCGFDDGQIRWAVAAGRWQRVHHGVVAITAAPLSLPARMWAAYLALGGSGVVAGRAAGHYWGLLDGELTGGQEILMFVDEPRHARVTGVVTRRVRGTSARAHPVRMPPVLNVEFAVIDLVRLAPTDAEAIEVIMRACRQRLTSPQRIREAMASVARVRRRPLIRSICADVAQGLTSPLEREFRVRVAIMHGLPVGRAQVPDAGPRGVVYRDVAVAEFRILVELDGRRGHESEADRFRDQERDNAAVLKGWATLRFGWLAVVGMPCEAAAQYADLLAGRGWRGRPRSCGPACAVGLRAAA